MFNRHTDRFISNEIKKKPLDVGADRIARTAHRALEIVGELRKECVLELPMAWEKGKVGKSSIIEVYPAATLKVTMDAEVESYKKKGGRDAREKMIGKIEEKFGLSFEGGMREKLIRSDDAFDAVICLISGAEFLRGNVRDFKERKGFTPEVIKKEGWIWFPIPHER